MIGDLLLQRRHLHEHHRARAAAAGEDEGKYPGIAFERFRVKRLAVLVRELDSWRIEHRLEMRRIKRLIGASNRNDNRNSKQR